MSEPTTYAKVENGIVTDVHVVTWEFLCDNPDRYGNSDLWIQCFQDNSGRGYCSKGWLYDANTDKFIDSSIEVNE